MRTQAQTITEAAQVLARTGSVLLVDWPSREVPTTLVTAGYMVFVKGGPDADAYSAWELQDGEVVIRQMGRPPDHADLVYAHRSLGESPGIVALAQQVGATAVWSQSGLSGVASRDPGGCWVEEEASRMAREIVESAGLTYVDSVYIADAVLDRGAR